jgi:hypothetical protein
MARIIVGVMGPGAASAEDCACAEELGALIAREGWALLTGGRDAGVMAAASRGARRAGGLTLGILPGDDALGLSPDIDVAIVTGLGQARNNVNVLTSRVVIACGMGPGTAAEVALALKAGRPVVLLRAPEAAWTFFRELGGERVRRAAGAPQAVALAREWLSSARHDAWPDTVAATPGQSG